MNNACWHFAAGLPPIPGIVSPAYGARVSQSGSVVSVEMPFPCVDGLFYRQRPGELIISRDLRLLYQDNDTLDSAAVVSLLMLGACVPPLTPFHQIRAFLPGFKYQIDLTRGAVQSEPTCRWSPLSEEDKTTDIGHQVEILGATLDSALRRACPSEDPIILFSGGVDSGVMTARVASLGWKNTSLIHYSFGDDDPETVNARQIASQFGMVMDVVLWNADAGYESLERAAALFPQPFCDHSCVPTHGLSRAVASRYDGNRVVLDGVGAEGCFEQWIKASRSDRLYRVPRFLRRVIGAFYGTLGLWHRENRLEQYSRLCRKSSFLPQLACLAAQNPLLGVAFYSDRESAETVARLCEDWIGGIARTKDIREMYPLLDIGLICAGIYAPKDLCPLRSWAFDPKYPFLEHDMVDLALSRVRFWPGNELRKNALNHLLAQAVSPELVFRKKKGFFAPLVDQFSHPSIAEHLEAVTGTNAVLGRYVEPRTIKKAVAYLASHTPLTATTYNFLWAVAFCNAWLSQLPEESRRLKKKAA